MVGSSTADDAPPECFTQAQLAIELKNCDLALRVQTQADEKRLADWHHLMGFRWRIERACLTGCEELRDLQKSQSDFKAKKISASAPAPVGSPFSIDLQALKMPQAV